MSITPIIKKLIIKEPFWGSILMQAEISESLTLTPMAGMYMKNEQLFISINPQAFFSKDLTDLHRIGILKHEVMHASFLHPLRGKNYERTIANIAADMEVNSYIPELTTLKNTQFRPLFAEDYELPPRKTMEWYIHELQKKVSKKKQSSGEGEEGEEGGDNDSNGSDPSTKESKKGSKKQKDAIAQQHKGWDTFKKYHKAVMERVLEKAGRFAGSTPSGIKEMLDNLYRGVLDWRWLLQKAILNGTRKARKDRFTWSRPNRRDDRLKGKKRLRMPDIVVAVDTSGSMSDDDVQRCFGEINKISRICNSLRLLNFDAAVTDKGKVNRLPKKVEITGRGGTDFTEVFDYVEKQIKGHKPLVIMLTDGYAEEGPKRNTMELIWIVLSKGNADKKWGQVIALPTEGVV